jgi:hypothetical protein
MVSQPSAPNPYATAGAQNQQNAFASQYGSATNNPNETNPYGTVKYTESGTQVPIYDPSGRVTGYAPRYERTTALSPDQQKLLDLETKAKTNLGNVGVAQSAHLQDTLKNQVDPSKWTPWQTDLKQQDLRQDQGTTDRAGIEKAMMDSYNRNVAPQENAQEASLAARGLSPGAAGYSQYQKTRDDSRAEAARQAYLTSGSESRAAQAAYNDVGTQRFNMNQAANAYQNNLRGAQMQEDYQRRSQAINETTALMSGSQATIPQFQAFQGQPVAASNIGQYIQDNYKNQSQAAAAMNAGIFGLGGGLAKLGVGMM